MKMKKRLLAVVLCAALISGCSYAENADRPGGGEEQLNTGQQDEDSGDIGYGDEDTAGDAGADSGQRQEADAEEVKILPAFHRRKLPLSGSSRQGFFTTTG